MWHDDANGPIRQLLASIKRDITAITLYVAAGATKEDAHKALDRAWARVEPRVGRPLRARERGAPTKWEDYVTHYRLWHDWCQTNETVKTAFAEQASEKRLPGCPAWLGDMSPMDIVKKLNRALRILTPEPDSCASLRQFLDNGGPWGWVVRRRTSRRGR
jgi:hypothetical protein